MKRLKASRRRNMRVALPLLEVARRLRAMRLRSSTRDLEQLVARIGLEDVAERLAGVARGRETETLDHRRHLVAQERDVARAAAVGERGEKSDEAALADGVALGVVDLHADVVEVARPVHRRVRVGLRDDDDVLRRAPACGCSGCRSCGLALCLLAAQDAEPGLDDRHRACAPRRCRPARYSR